MRLRTGVLLAGAAVVVARVVSRVRRPEERVPAAPTLPPEPEPEPAPAAPDEEQVPEGWSVIDYPDGPPPEPEQAKAPRSSRRPAAE